MSYMLELFRKHKDTDKQVPSWHIFDARFRGRYFVGPLFTSRFRPDWMLPKSYETSGFLTKANTVAELAKKTGIDPAGLEATIAAMNAYAKTGKDLEFGRGDAEYDRYYGDPTVKPNPCLAPIDQAPFYAYADRAGRFRHPWRAGHHGPMPSLNTRMAGSFPASMPSATRRGDPADLSRPGLDPGAGNDLRLAGRETHRGAGSGEDELNLKFNAKAPRRQGNPSKNLSADYADERR